MTLARLNLAENQSYSFFELLKDLGLEEMAIILFIFLKFELVLDLFIEEHEAFILDCRIFILSCDYICELILNASLGKLANTCCLADLAIIFVLLALQIENLLLHHIFLELSICLNAILIDGWTILYFDTFSLHHMLSQLKSFLTVAIILERLFKRIRRRFLVVMNTLEPYGV